MKHYSYLFWATHEADYESAASLYMIKVKFVGPSGKPPGGYSIVKHMGGGTGSKV